jgi:hypothetical protein
MHPARPVRRSPWRSALAGAVIGFLEAAGSESERRALHRPLAVVRFEDREPARATRPVGLWFLEPLARPVPGPGGLRPRRPMRLRAVSPEWLVRRLGRVRGLSQ